MTPAEEINKLKLSLESLGGFMEAIIASSSIDEGWEAVRIGILHATAVYYQEKIREALK